MQRIQNYSANENITQYIRERGQMLENHRNVFTHGDLDWSNIMIVDKTVSGIIDLECSGFLPPYCEWIAVKKLSDNHPWLALLEPRLESAEWIPMWEVEQLISALHKHSQWALTPQKRAANQAEGWNQVTKILGARVGDLPLPIYTIQSQHPWWLEYKQPACKRRTKSNVDSWKRQNMSTDTRTGETIQGL